MGLRYRKSVKLPGGFRVNFSKSGVGYSWGVKGYRYTKTAKGTTRRTYSVPGTGFSYVTEEGKKKSSAEPTTIESHAEELGVGSLDDCQPVDYQEFLSAAEGFLKWDYISNWLIATFILASTGNIIFILTCLAGIVIKIYANISKSIFLEYLMDEYTEEKYSNVTEKWLSLNKSSGLWQIITSSRVTDKKHNAGASNSITRQKIRITKSHPRFVKSKIQFVTLKLKRETVYLLPEKILIVRKRKVGVVSYDELKFNKRGYRFIENQKVPSDAEIVDHTWQKVNKDGSPDKRFKNNRKLPVCNYGLLTMQTAAGMDVRICCSNIHLLDNF